MADLLGAYSFIFTAITALYSIWYPEAKNFIHTQEWPPDVDPANIPGQFVVLKTIKRTRIIPLLLASLGIALIFLPTIISILYSGFQELCCNEWVWSSYDPVSICLLFLLVLNIFLVSRIVEFHKEVRIYLRLENYQSN